MPHNYEVYCCMFYQLIYVMFYNYANFFLKNIIMQTFIAKDVEKYT